jgi:hypothetical protein
VLALLLLGEAALLVFKVTLRLGGGLLLGEELLLLALLEYALLVLVLAVLAVDLGLPKVRDLAGLLLGGGRRRGRALNLLLGAGRRAGASSSGRRLGGSWGSLGIWMRLVR